jgi:two-component system LytT family response regulator
MRAVHIDDEKDSLEVLRILIEQHCPQVELVASATSVDEGISIIKEHEPQLVFLDIEMPGKNGFVLLDELKEHSFQVVMVTGYENYAIKAIKYSALDYLLKPLDALDLVEAVNKAMSTKDTALDRLAHYRGLISKEDDAYSSLMIASSNGYKNIDIHDLMYVKAESGSYSVLYFSDGSKEVVSKPLNHFESILPEDDFFRIHRSHVVNLSCVKAYDIKSATVTLADDAELLVSTRKKSDFRKKITV